MWSATPTPAQLQTMQQSALGLVDELCSVGHGVRDASKIHRIANDFAKLFVKEALPLIGTLSAHVLADETSSMSVAVQQDAASTATPRVSSGSAASEGAELRQDTEALLSSSRCLAHPAALPKPPTRHASRLMHGVAWLQSTAAKVLRALLAQISGLLIGRKVHTRLTGCAFRILCSRAEAYIP